MSDVKIYTSSPICNWRRYHVTTQCLMCDSTSNFHLLCASHSSTTSICCVCWSNVLHRRHIINRLSCLTNLDNTNR
uniref:Uncharacterized protein n=1 Tax=Bird deltacoronavirus AnasCN24 TaxID=3237947 RepID=A0AB39AGA0_9NIDO